MRGDILWVVPSVIVASYQIFIVWNSLPTFRREDTEISGTYSERFEWVWFRNIKYLVYATFWFQVFFPLYQIRCDETAIWVLRCIGYALVFGGFFISYAAVKTLGNNWSGMVDYRIKKGQILQTQGIYSVIRHPIYFAVIIEMVGYELIVTSWLAIPIFVFSFFVFSKHIHNEDGLLEKKFGEEFIQYKRRVKAFIPFLY